MSDIKKINNKEYGQILPDLAEENITDTRKNMGYIYDSVNDFLIDVDPRIKEYHDSICSTLNNNMDDINEGDLILRDSNDRLQNTYSDYRRAKRAAEEVNQGAQDALTPKTLMQDVGKMVAAGLNSVFNPEQKTLKIDQHKWNEQSPAQQNNIIQKLKEHGLTDSDINNAINGNIVVDQAAFEELKAELSEAIKHNPATIVKIEEVLGFPILDENGQVDNNKLKLAMMVAGKNLGMDIDMTAGSPFKKEINSLTVDIQSAYRKDPTIRNKVIEAYGVDIFDINGKVDQEKLALIRVIDGINTSDKYDIKSLLGLNNIQPQQSSIIKNQNNNSDISPTPVNPNEDDLNNKNQKGNENGPEIVKPTDTITPGIGDNSINEKNTESLKASVKDGFGNVGGGILDAIEKGASRIAKGVSPYSGNVGATKGMNKATAGIIAAASVAAGGVAAGGGLLVSKKLNIIHFTPADWQALGADYQSIIEALMRKVGFSTDDVETFKNSKFKIATAELKEHVKKIEKAIDSNPTCDDELLKLYNYSMLDDQNRVIDYLLFITMIIDGRNTIDEYNMYNVINQSLDNVDDADFIYNGIDMEDYFDDSEDEEIKVLNDPTSTEDSSISTDEEEKTDQSTNLDKEWLKGIGIDD